MFVVVFLLLLDGCQQFLWLQERALFSDVDDPIEDLYHLIREEVAGDSSFESLDEMILPQQAHPRQSQVKSSHLYLYSAFKQYRLCQCNFTISK